MVYATFCVKLMISPELEVRSAHPDLFALLQTDAPMAFSPEIIANFLKTSNFIKEMFRKVMKSKCQDSKLRCFNFFDNITQNYANFSYSDFAKTIILRLLFELLEQTHFRVDLDIW